MRLDEPHDLNEAEYAFLAIFERTCRRFSYSLIRYGIRDANSATFRIQYGTHVFVPLSASFSLSRSPFLFTLSPSSLCFLFFVQLFTYISWTAILRRLFMQQAWRLFGHISFALAFFNIHLPTHLFANSPFAPQSDSITQLSRVYNISMSALHTAATEMLHPPTRNGLLMCSRRLIVSSSPTQSARLLNFAPTLRLLLPTTTPLIATLQTTPTSPTALPEYLRPPLLRNIASLSNRSFSNYYTTRNTAYIPSTPYHYNLQL